MMKNQLKFRAVMLVIALMTTATTASAAGRPFGRRMTRSYQPSTSPSQYAHANTRQANRQSTPVQARGILRSPQRMTQIYGPSILIRGANASSQVSSKVVSQP